MKKRIHRDILEPSLRFIEEYVSTLESKQFFMVPMMFTIERFYCIINFD
jgi:hypothetical protein